jgi:hypothetical protein
MLAKPRIEPPLSTKALVVKVVAFLFGDWRSFRQIGEGCLEGLKGIGLKLDSKFAVESGSFVCGAFPTRDVLIYALSGCSTTYVAIGILADELGPFKVSPKWAQLVEPNKVGQLRVIGCFDRETMRGEVVGERRQSVIEGRSHRAQTKRRSASRRMMCKDKWRVLRKKKKKKKEEGANEKRKRKAREEEKRRETLREKREKTKTEGEQQKTKTKKKKGKTRKNGKTEKKERDANASRCDARN